MPYIAVNEIVLNGSMRQSFVKGKELSMPTKKIGSVAMAALSLVLPLNVCSETERVGGYTWQYFVRDVKAWIGSQQNEVAAIFHKPVGEVAVPSELGSYEILGTNFGCC